MRYKYQFKNKELEEALGVIFGEEYADLELQRQMKDANESLYLEINEPEGIKSSITIPKEEAELVYAYDPDDWNPFPQVKPESGYWLVQFENGELDVKEFCNFFYDEASWNCPDIPRVVAFRKLPELYKAPESCE